MTRGMGNCSHIRLHDMYVIPAGCDMTVQDGSPRVWSGDGGVGAHLPWDKGAEGYILDRRAHNPLLKDSSLRMDTKDAYRIQ